MKILTLGMISFQNALFLTSVIRKSRLLCNFKCILQSSVCGIHPNDKVLTTVCMLDDFTEQLVNEQTRKWVSLRQKQIIVRDHNASLYDNVWKMDFKLKLNHLSKCNKLDIDICKFTTQQIDSLILSALDSEEIYNVTYLISQCHINQRCPSLEVLLETLNAYSLNGNIKMVSSLIALTAEVEPNIKDTNFGFEHYLAKAYWMKGNVEKALKMFIVLYKNNNNIRTTILNMLKFLITDSVSHHSEASVVIMRKYLIQFGEIWEDWNPIVYLWEACWLSEWFGDQQLANELFLEYEPLRKVVCESVTTMTMNALNRHQVDCVVRLLQIILQLNMRSQYEQVIGTLFNYKYKRGDLGGCYQIIMNCIELDICLASIYHKKYLNILIEKGFLDPSPVKQIKESKVETFKLQF